MQSNSMIHGADVAKDELVVQCLGERGTVCLRNNTHEIRGWLRQLPKGSVVAMESTGKYHQLLARLAYAAGMRVYVLNARRLYFYAKSLEMRAKTDRVDAGVIARFVSEHQQKLHPWQPACPEHARIDEMLRRRAVAVVKRESLRQSLGDCKDLKLDFRKLDRALAEFVRCIDRKIDELIAADAKLSSARRLIDGVTGFGPVGSALLAVLLERIPFANSDALVAFSGCDPRPVDSGQRRGRRKLTKAGPSYLRKQWFMTGLSAIRTKALKPMYQALRARGLETTEAAIILGRKLLKVAYAVWKTQSPFDMQMFLSRSAPV